MTKQSHVKEEPLSAESGSMLVSTAKGRMPAVRRPIRGQRVVLERAGFELEWDRGDVVAYVLAKPVAERRRRAEH